MSRFYPLRNRLKDMDSICEKCQDISHKVMSQPDLDVRQELNALTGLVASLACALHDVIEHQMGWGAP